MMQATLMSLGLVSTQVLLISVLHDQWCLCSSRRHCNRFKWLVDLAQPQHCVYQSQDIWSILIDYLGKCPLSILDSKYCIKKEECIIVTSQYFYTFTHAVTYQWPNIPSSVEMIIPINCQYIDYSCTVCIHVSFMLSSCGMYSCLFW